jgi:hypothetical protein
MGIENPKKITWILALSIFHFSFCLYQNLKVLKFKVVFGDFQ